jgi:tetratricopeptide (TPR) repeat protein
MNLAGNISMLDGNFDIAKIYFEKALSQDSASSLACSGLGDILFISGNYEAAKTMYEWGVKNDSGNQAAIEGLAKVNKLFNYPENSNSLLEYIKDKKEIETQPDESKPETDKLIEDAYELFNKNNFDSALKKLTQAEKLFNGQLSNPTDNNFASSFYNMKGFIYLGLKDIDKAKACFEKALGFDSNSSQACAGLGEILYLSEQDQQSKTMFEWAVKNNPNNMVAVGGLQKVNKLLGYPENHSSLNITTESRIDIKIKHRDEFGQLFNKLGLFGKGVEIGVQEGMFSKTLRSTWKGEELYLIDRWKYDPDYKDIANVSDTKQKEFYLSVVQKFSEDSSVQILRKDSLTAANQFPDNYFDWIYIDADHSFDGCSKDLKAWYPKLRSGGILAGHDYLDGEYSAGSFGVKSAVDNFIKNKKVKLFITDDAPCRSWYFGKHDSEVAEEDLHTSGANNMNVDTDSQKSVSNLNEILTASFELFGKKSFQEAITNLDNSKDLFYSQNEKELISAFENLKGLNYLGLNEKENAHKCFETALNVNPQSSQAFAGLGELMYLNNKDAEAKKMFETALKYNPVNLFAAGGLSKINRLLGFPYDHSDLEDNVSDVDSFKFKAALNQILESSFELFGLKYFNEAIDNLNKSEELFYSQKNIELTSAFENLKGFNYLGLDNKDSARVCFETALNVNPKSSQACAGLAELFYLEGKDKEAKTMYEYAIENNPDNQFAKGGLEKVNEILKLAEVNN